jgi:LysM repeat protein
MQREFDKLAEENKQLRAQVETLRIEVEKWRAYYASRTREQPTGSNPTPVPQLTGTQLEERSASPTERPARRTHTVKSGDTLTSIASRYGVRLDALQAANPSVDPRRMRIGDVLNVPAD